MNQVTKDHRHAMELADEGDIAKRNGETERAKILYGEALEYERRAAEAVSMKLDLEPTRSVLHRSAASLALECGELREAERLIAVALSGNPPEEIAEELRDLLQLVYQSFRKTPVGVTQ